MIKLLKILQIGGVFLILNNSSLLASNNVVSLKDLDNINKTIKYDKLVNIHNGKVEIDQDPERIYLFSNDKYYTSIVYNEQFRNLSNRNREFFERWLMAKYLTDNSIESNNLDTKIALIKNQIDVFYKELMIIDSGKIYNFIVQEQIASKMKKELVKNDKIQLELIYIGKNQNSGNNFFIITNYSKGEIIKSTNSTTKESDYIIAKRFIRNGQYDAALLRLNNFLKNNPNNLDARKDVCLIKYLSASKLYNKNYTSIIACYEDLAKMYQNSEIYYTLATLYYIDSSISNRFNKVFMYSKLAVDSLKKDGKDSGSNQILYCNSLYLLGISKLVLKDNDGIMDIEHAQTKCPELTNIDLFSNQ